MESVDRMEKIRRERIRDFGAGSRGKERVGRVEQFDDRYGLGDRIKHGDVFHANNSNYAYNNHMRIPIESFTSRPVSNQYGVNSTGPSRFDNFHHYGEGPSRYDHPNRIYYEHVEKMSYNPGYDGVARLEHLETDRAELIRKLDELKDTLTRSCDLNDKPKERFGGGNNQMMLPPTRPNPHIGHHHGPHVQEEGYYTQGPKTMNLAAYDKETPYISPGHESIPYPNLRHSFPQERHVHDRVVLQTHESLSYQPEARCSCVYCCNGISDYRYLHEKVDPSVICDRTSRNGPSYPGYNCHMTPIKSESHSREALSSCDQDSDKSSFETSRPKKIVTAKRIERVCRPIAGGAPFITCSACFELLKLPRKHISPAKVQQKMKCGACSSIILFELRSNGLISSISERVHNVPVEIYQDSFETEDGKKIFLHGDSKNSYDDSSDGFNADPRLSPKETKSNSCEPVKESDPISSIYNLSGDEKTVENIEVEPTVHPDSTRQESSDTYSDNFAENNTQRSELEKAGINIYRQSSLNEEDTVATEMDVSISELPNSLVSQTSETTIKDDHSKDASSSNFGDFTDRNKFLYHVALSHVFVNGHLIPEHEVKKAEKLAGPIQPGEYWYDTIAGFWGVIGHRCLGIIMPNVEEFNYPMPTNCAAGNTSVYVNGRELHQKDLDLLVSRGLPHTRNRSYIIDISGKVINEQTGQELDGLGNLAPTVQRAKHGFGMKVPKFIAQQQLT